MMSCRQSQDRTRVQSAAEITAHRHICAQTNPYRLFERCPQLGGVIGIGTLKRGRVDRGIVEVPIPMELNMLLGGDQVMSRWNLVNPVKQGAHRMSAKFDGVIDRLRVPAGRDSGGK